MKNTAIEPTNYELLVSVVQLSGRFLKIEVYNFTLLQPSHLNISLWHIINIIK